MPSAMHTSNADTTPRLFLPDDLAADVAVTLSDAQAHYLGRVMRMGPGEQLRLFNGRDGEWLARLDSIGRKQAVCLPETQLRPQAGDADIWLAFAPLKREATELVVEKATELGVSRLCPVFTDRTNTGRINAERWRAIAIEAAEQCERLSIPDIAEPVRLPALLANWPTDRPLAAAIERQPHAMLRPLGPSAGLLIGPEGGFASLEVELLRRHPFVVAVGLGPRILRAETAAIVGLALLQSRDGG